jgi:hypothetical protein
MHEVASKWEIGPPASLPFEIRCGVSMLERIVKETLGSEVKAINKTNFEKAMEKGLQEGIKNTILQIGRERLGNPGPETEKRIHSIDDRAKLDEITQRILHVKTWDELMGPA